MLRNKKPKLNSTKNNVGYRFPFLLLHLPSAQNYPQLLNFPYIHAFRILSTGKEEKEEEK